MKSEPLEPPRLEEEGPEALRRLVRARRGRPAGANVDKIAQQLARAGVLGQPVERKSKIDKASGYAKLGFIGVALAGGVALTWESVRAPATAPNVAEVAPSAVEREPDTTSEQAPAASGPAIAVDQLPSAELSAPRETIPSPSPSLQRPSAKPRPGSAGVNRAGSELELLQRAQSVVASDPSRALSLTNEHVRDYPSGEFVQEREMLAIEALARLGEKQAARRRADALLERFPRTPYSAKIEMLLGRSP